MTMLKKIEFGDFQTPPSLADEVCGFLVSTGIDPDAIIEPTCGSGSFLLSAVKHFHKLKKVVGYDINPNHLQNASRMLESKGYSATLEVQDFFNANWNNILSGAGDRPLLLGNLPWVTSARLGSMNSDNLPEKANFQRHEGLAAKTGKANFDISEWMLIKLLEASRSIDMDIAILCKVATARKVLKYAWMHGHPVSKASLHLIDAALHFGASVSACLLYMRIRQDVVKCVSAEEYSGLNYELMTGQVGTVKGELVSDAKSYSTYSQLDGHEQRKWRSGIKHDAASIMELELMNGRFLNKLGEECVAESAHLFPFLKSSDLANGRTATNRFVVVPQFRTNENTLRLKDTAPKLWAYLEDHKTYFDMRKSSIYRNRPKYSIFGVGPYTFAPWKVAVAGLYKAFQFVKIGCRQEKPVLLDDTCYFLSFWSEAEADSVLELLQSGPAQTFLRSLTFFDAKRPVTIEVLKRLDLIKLSEFLGKHDYAAALRLQPAESPSDQKTLSF